MWFRAGKCRKFSIKISAFRLNVVSPPCVAENIYLRAAMGEPRLNNLMVLHRDQYRADKLNLKAVSREFVSACDQSSNLFLEITN